MAVIVCVDIVSSNQWMKNFMAPAWSAIVSSRLCFSPASWRTDNTVLAWPMPVIEASRTRSEFWLAALTKNKSSLMLDEPALMDKMLLIFSPTD